MILKKYNIELHRVREEDLEMIRLHRNSDFIKSKMFYQKEISKAEQKQWFSKINNEKYFYFIIKFQNKPVGLAHGIVHSFEKGEAEGGVFFWEKDVLKTHVPVVVSVCMTDLTFLLLKMEKTIAEVRSDNLIAINYNKQLGYSIVNEDIEEGKLLMELKREDYLNKTNKYRALVKKISKDPSDITWEDIQIPKDSPAQQYENLPDSLREIFIAKLNKSRLNA